MKRTDKSCAEQLRLIGTDIRLEVLRQLSSGPKLVHELNDVLDVEQSLLSHHLQVLRENGLVQSRREGKAVRYRLTREARTAGTIDLGCCSLTFE
jgi:DNA-binding transcriptional ArsR family regulator